MAEIMGISEEELFTPGHSGCYGCGEAIAIRHIMKAAGKNTIAVQATGCPEVYSTVYPLTAWKVPWIHAAFENAAAVASGVREGLNEQDKKEVNVIAIAGDGGTYDIGFQALSGALERGHKFLYVCLQNEAYMNTGIQRSGATEKYSWTTTSPIGKKIIGKGQYRKPMPLIVASHHIPYVATASLHNLIDLKNKIKKALSTDGPSYIEILCPCIPGWVIESDMAYDLDLLAFKTNIWPLYEIINGKLILTKNEDTKKIEEYFKHQGRFKHLLKPENKKLLDELQQHVDAEYKKLENMEKFS
jgi:pyruvate ferredoxin oxidoreductase beta subunit